MTRSFTILDGFFLLLLFALTLAFFSVISPFLIAIFLAVIVAVAFRRPYRFLCTRLAGRRYAAAAATVSGLILLIAVPLLLAGLMVYTEILGGYTYIAENWPELSERLEEIDIMAFVEGVPVLSDAIARFDFDSAQLDEILENALSASSDFLVSATQDSFASIAQAVLNIFVFFVLFFFLLIDGERLWNKVRTLLPLSTGEVDRISDSAQGIVTATLLTNFGLGLVEGALGTLYFYLFDLPSPFLWGMLMVIFSIIPMIGANLVMIPAGLILVVTGSPVRGIALIILSAGTVAVTQNVVRPAVLGERSGLHPALVLLSTVGGLSVLGIIGFLVGPLLAALFIVIWNEFGSRFETELSSRDSRNEVDGSPDAVIDSQAPMARRRRVLRAGPPAT